MKMEIVAGYPDILLFIIIIRRLRKTYRHDTAHIVKCVLKLQESNIRVGIVFTMDMNSSSFDGLLVCASEFTFI